MTFLIPYLITFAVILLFMTLVWGLSVRLTNASIIDIAWGAGFVIAVWFYFWLTPEGALPRKWLITGLATVWGGRLALYLLWRNWGEEEDWRYQSFRRAGGERWWLRSLVTVFGLQGTVMWIVSAPLLVAQLSPTPAALTWLDYLGVIVWGIGFFFEAVGDWQLARFKANPANQGKLLTDGLWRYTRHPNYFGDAVQWWGFFLIAASVPFGYLTIICPIIMTFLLMRVSGVVLTERRLKSVKPGYETYIATTNTFVPGLPKKQV
ncbi:MAG: DUF1295 domain-containing protein [Chloroflexota bacterium]